MKNTWCVPEFLKENVVVLDIEIFWSCYFYKEIRTHRQCTNICNRALLNHRRPNDDSACNCFVCLVHYDCINIARHRERSPSLVLLIQWNEKNVFNRSWYQPGISCDLDQKNKQSLISLWRQTIQRSITKQIKTKLSLHTQDFSLSIDRRNYCCTNILNLFLI